jgi:antitoxin component of MazEF toxin-antitoxin module
MKKVNVRGEGKLKPTMHRKVRVIGGSYCIALPKAFIMQHQLKKGDLLALIFGESLRITPVNKGE